MKGIGAHPDWGITVVRLMTGLVFVVHGYQKFAGGISGAATFFAKVGIPFPGLMAPSSLSWNSWAASCSASVSQPV